MAYEKDIPQANDLISSSQPKILANFQALQSIMANNHYTWDDTASSYEGLHTFITFPEVQAPAVGAHQGIMYPATDTNDSNSYCQMFWVNQTRTYQMTNGFYKQGTSGYYMFPLGRNTVPSLIMMWGQVSATNPSTQVDFHTITNYTGGGYTTGFPNSVFNVTVSPVLDAANTFNSKGWTVAATGTDKQKFFINYSGSGVAGLTFYWQAIGN